MSQTFSQSSSPKEVELFDEFFESGKEESISPFLTPSSKRWGRNLSLKVSSLGALFLFLSFLFSYFFNDSGLSNLFLLFSFFIVGTPALIDTLEDLLAFEVNIDILMTLSAFLSILIGSGQEGALLLVLFAMSGAIEKEVKLKARSAVSSLKKIMPTKAYVLAPDGSLLERAIQDITAGMTLLVKAGELIPLDGNVIKGRSSVNLSHLTGESIPVTKMEGDEVAAGSLNIDGSLTIVATRTSKDSTLARIIQQITEAEKAKPKITRFFDRIGRTYAIAIILAAFFFALVLPLIFSISYTGKEGSFYRSIAFLIAASPCALVIATPIAYLSAISALARLGIILKGGVVLDGLATCRSVALDKTGTLTMGELSCIGVEPIKGEDVAQAIAFAAALEKGSRHPMAMSIENYAQKNKVQSASLSSFKSYPGYGLEGLSQGKRLFIGNKAFIFPKIKSEELTRVEKRVALLEEKGLSYTILLIDEEEIWFFSFEDALRPKLSETLHLLKERWKLKLFMVTGDHLASAKRVAKNLPFDAVFADLKPGDKLEKIAQLAKERDLAMVGDGINDAPALARATVGISMGKGGSRTAIDASDIILLQDRIELLPDLFAKAKLTRQIVIQNLLFALLVIATASTLALLGLIPLWVAVLLHEGGTLLVGVNALRLLRKN